MHDPMTREERLAEIERLMTLGVIAALRLWKSLPDPDNQLPHLPPQPIKPGQLRRLAARMRDGLVPDGAVDLTIEEVERFAIYQRRAIWCWHKMRALEARLKPLWDAEDAEAQKDEQKAFHRSKKIATAHPGSSMDTTFQSMKRSFRKRVGRGSGS
jgi:hypothetical protein